MQRVLRWTQSVAAQAAYEQRSFLRDLRQAVREVSTWPPYHGKPLMLHRSQILSSD